MTHWVISVVAPTAKLRLFEKYSIFWPFFTMAACYEGNSDSDASSDDVSLPFFSKPGQFHKQGNSTIPLFSSPMVTPESKMKSERKIGIDSRKLHKIPESSSPSSFDDLITGDTPPLTKRKGSKASQDEGAKKMSTRVVKHHDIMRHSGGLLTLWNEERKCFMIS